MGQMEHAPHEGSFGYHAHNPTADQGEFHPSHMATVEADQQADAANSRRHGRGGRRGRGGYSDGHDRGKKLYSDGHRRGRN